METGMETGMERGVEKRRGIECADLCAESSSRVFVLRPGMKRGLCGNAVTFRYDILAHAAFLEDFLNLQQPYRERHFRGRPQLSRLILTRSVTP